MTVVSSQQFRAVIAAGPRGRAVIAVPFDPDKTWGTKADHPVGGTIEGKRVRGRLSPTGSGWQLTVTPMWLRDTGVTIGTEVAVELAPEGPQREDLADDIAAALAGNPAPPHSSTRWRSSTARPTSAGSRRPPAVRISARPGSPKWSTCSRRGSNSAHDRDGNRAPRALVVLGVAIGVEGL